MTDYETVNEKRFQLWHECNQPELDWNAKRYHRLCETLRLTEAELGAFLRLSRKEVCKWLTRDSFPAHVELLLTMTERAAIPLPDRRSLIPPL